MAKEKKRVLFFTSYFYPEIFRGNDLAFDMVSKGYEVTVITNIPNYPKGKYYDGYGFFSKRKEIVNGVKVMRLPVVPRGSGGKLGLMLNYLSELFIMSIFSLFHSLFHRYDLVVVQQLSPATIAIPAIIVKSIQRIPLIYWLLDLWPESLVVGGVSNKKIINALSKMMNFIYNRCDKILISSYGFRKALENHHIPQSKIVYFPNWGDESLVNNINNPIEVPDIPKGFKIMFAGNIGEAQNLENVMKVAYELKKRGFVNVKWIFVGGGRKIQWIKDYIFNNDLGDVVFLIGHYPIETMPSFFSKADCMLVSLNNELAFNLVMPAKVQAYMSCSKVILGMVNGETSEVIRNANCGFSCGSDDINAMVDTIIEMQKLNQFQLEELGRNGHDYYNARFDKDICMINFENILKEELTK